MHRFASAFLAVCLLAVPLSATAGALCPMMAGSGMAPPASVSFSAQANPCCPKGACDCSVKAASPMNAQAPQILRTVAPDIFVTTLSSESVLAVKDVSAQKQEASESPPAPDKLYKLTSQYRI